MRLFVENSFEKKELPLENGKYSLDTYNCYLQISLSEHEEVKIVCFEKEDIFQGKGVYTVPIIWNKTNSFIFSIVINKKIFKYLFQLNNVKDIDDEGIINLLKFADQIDSTFQIEKEYSIFDLYDSIKDNSVSLIIEKTPYVGYDDQSLLRKIREVVPMVMDICSHPKQNLKKEEAVLDVSLVKRINSRTMSHLSSHSEHWKSRSLNGLTPNRLRTDIFEDEINIYENLFFRMAIDDVLKYIYKQVTSIKRTIQQNDNAIDWNTYGEELSDYKRGQIFKKLLPDYNVIERKDKVSNLEKLLKQWEKLENSFSTVEASRFYRSIDNKRHISRNIKPTNIIKKDSRYNALYRLWCEILRQNAIEQQESSKIAGNGEISLSSYYSMYVVVLLLYVFKLIDYDVDKSSIFHITKDGEIIVDAMFSNESISFHVITQKNKYATLDIVIQFIEKIQFKYDIPNEAIHLIEKIKKVVPSKAEVKYNSIVFYSVPSNDEIKTLKNVFHLNKTAKRGLGKEEIRRMDDVDEVWRSKLEEFFASGKIRHPRNDEIVIKPQFVSLMPSEVAIGKFTQLSFDGINEKTMFVLPIELSEYRDCVKTDKIINRLLSYGERYYKDESLKWGDYKVGMIPVSQTEISSVQRLMKLIFIHAARLQIKWTDSKSVRCPICGSDDCSEEDNNNWRCNNTKCQVLFGIKTHNKEKGGCGLSYEWTRPFVRIKRSDISTEDYLDLMIKKELIFDRLAITDFELEPQDDGRVKYISICPKCGRIK